MKPYSITYRMNGISYGGVIGAESFEDAERRLKAMGRGEVVGRCEAFEDADDAEVERIREQREGTH